MNKYSVILLSLAFTACSPATHITSSWKSPDASGVKYKNILVIALSQPDNVLKEKMEQHLVGDLKSRSVGAQSAYQLYGPKAFDNLDEKSTIDKIQNSAADAILTIVLLDKSKERDYVSGHIVYTPYAVYYNRFWGYYTTLYNRIYSPGYYVTNTEYFWESNLYDAKSRKLIYSVQTKTFNPANSESLAHEYGLSIIKNMVQEGVIG
jgi:hypothetical protein